MFSTESNAHKTRSSRTQNFTYLPVSDDDTEDPASSRHVSSKFSTSVWKTIALCEFCILLLFTLLFFNTGHSQNNLPYYSLVRDVIKYETRVLHNSVGSDLSPYQGPPSPELDSLWFGTYEGGIFKISKEEERRLPNRTSAIPGDSENYISTLAVFHHLHCLNYIRKTLHPDYYTEMDLKNATILEHTEHCIDILREALMCSPDTTAGIWQWHPSDQRSLATWDIAHTCVKYDEIQKWAMSRALYEYDDTVWVEGNPMHS